MHNSSSLVATLTSVVRMVSIPSSAVISASDTYTNENVVSLVLTFIMVWFTHNTWDSSSTHFALCRSKRDFIPSSKLRLTRSTNPLVCRCLTEANLCVMLSVVHHYFECLEIVSHYLKTISLERPNLHEMFSHTIYFTSFPVIVTTTLASIHFVK